ncbi:dipeptide/oligopeptide/nickel ABC transporter ATP-binding protein [Candidatus Epulonipiscium fishelsonii]|uniref:Dipeptide/oligopeptide/nickel ABC transporter ATP-binding protein n=1 Tax=Candidatus Epulonipiscium fishelsonii TaxID=77094 RepID=A0ACC8X8G6_9FIRM|nr:dipeptide/oligopeptide/nickel ABC transporter ATP-binding protein [Epulopiscium sp. SCG-B11WGA-EpuloA1]ONI43063.1 dipeptide/oligopeptide/nickel ABC transporter ATP-binding protein [Epulopiscium sp. SCG-B05WGA-EpuloA1]
MGDRAVQKEAKKRMREIAKSNRAIVKKFEDEKKRKHVPKLEYQTEMHNPNNILEIDNLHTYFYTDMGTVKSVNGVTLEIPQGKTVALVGESGCGKSVTSLSIMKLVRGPSGQITNGQIRYNRPTGPIDIVKTPISQMQDIRGNEISMIFQEPMTSLNPVFRIGSQIDEAIMIHRPDIKKSEVKKQTIKMLELVGIARAEGIYKSFPHELSGGMRQRVMIAMSLCCNPRLIIADEPTTALDVTIQAQVLELLRDLKTKIDASILLITHDLGVVAEMADFVVVMYAGKIVEQGTAIDVFLNPQHPYTMGLIKSKPVVNQEVDRLYSIPGQVPNPVHLPNHCFFKDRCDKCIECCSGDIPELRQIGQSHKVACHLYDEEEA